MIFLKQKLCIAKECFPLEVRHQQQLLEKGPRYLIRLGDLRHVAVDTLMQPGEDDDIDTGLGISIWASGTLHYVASGWWLAVMSLKDSLFRSPSYHHQRFC